MLGGFFFNIMGWGIIIVPYKLLDLRPICDRDLLCHGHLQQSLSELFLMTSDSLFLPVDSVIIYWKKYWKILQSFSFGHISSKITSGAIECYRLVQKIQQFC